MCKRCIDRFPHLKLLPGAGSIMIGDLWVSAEAGFSICQATHDFPVNRPYAESLITPLINALLYKDTFTRDLDTLS